MEEEAGRKRGEWRGKRGRFRRFLFAFHRTLLFFFFFSVIFSFLVSFRRARSSSYLGALAGETLAGETFGSLARHDVLLEVKEGGGGGGFEAG